MNLKENYVETAGICLLTIALFTFTGFFTKYNSPTLDEYTDLGIINCLMDGLRFFDCTWDISQFRLIYIVPLILLKITGGHNILYASHLASAAFTAATLPILFYCVKKVSSSFYAWLAGALFCCHPTLLNPAVITLTHSFAELIFFTTASVYAFLLYQEKPDFSNFLYLVIALALTFSSSLVSVFTMPAFAIGIIIVRFPPVKWIIYGIVIFAVIFFSFNFYLLSAENFGLFRQSTSHAGDITSWNYLGLNSPIPPWYFGLVVLFIRFMPTMTLLLLAALPGLGRKDPLVYMVIAILIFNLIKILYFHYDAPHHQWYYYPFYIVVICKWIYSLQNGAWKTFATSIIAVSVCWGLFDSIRLYPNLLFYGAQYGDAFIGEFYGPAVIHSQNSLVVTDYLKKVRGGERGPVLCLEGSIIQTMGYDVKFTHQSNDSLPLYAISDRISLTMNVPDKKDFSQFLAAHYNLVYQYDFPYNKWAYRVHKLKPQFQAQ